MFRKSLSILLALVMVLSIFTSIPFSVSAKEVDIAKVGNPYPPDQDTEYGDHGDGYYEIPCTWFAWKQAHDRLGISLPAWGHGGEWFYNAQSDPNYQTGSVPRANSIACWTGGTFGHVAYVVSTSGGNTFTVDEGGRTDLDHTDSHGVAYGYTLTNAVGEYRPQSYPLVLQGFIYLDVPPDNEKPKVNNKYISLITNDSFRVCVDATDNIGIREVRIATWSQGDQSDLIWKTANHNGAGTYFVDNQRSNYADSIYYYNHIYVYDYAGNCTVAVIDMDYSNYGETADTEKPTVLEKYISEVTDNSFRICIVPNDNKGIKQVRIATWSKEDQSDVIWRNAAFNGSETYFVDINRADYSSGTMYYYSHAYIYDYAGNYCVCSMDMDYRDNTPPTIEAKYLSEITDNSFRVCVVPKDLFGIKQVRVATWTQYDQSDLIWKTANYNGEGTYFVDLLRSDYADSTKYYNHIYVYDNSDNYTAVEIIMDYNPKTTILGDVDGDDEVTIIDATCIQRKLANIPTAAFVEAAADADGDGELSIIDATVIQRHLAQLPAPEGIGKPIT